MDIIPYMASLSVHKKRGLGLYLHDLKLSRSYQSGAADSGVNEMPIGRDELKEGCRNRCLSLTKSLNITDAKARVFSVEGGLISRKGRSFYDTCCVGIYNPSKQKFVYEFGEEYEMPYGICNLFANTPGLPEVTTVGKILQAVGMIQDHSNPTASLHGVERYETIYKALLKLPLPSQI